MAKQPRRLARVLSPAGPGPFFSFYSSALGTLYDDEIRSVTIHRGKPGRGGGVHPSTLEIALTAGPVLGVTGSGCRFGLRTGPSERLAAVLGVTGPQISERFTGRLTQSDVEDTGRRLNTTYRAGSWITRLMYSPVHSTPTAGQSLNRVIADLMKLNTPAPLAGISATFLGTFDTISKTTEPVLYKDAINKYTADLGILVRETRAGVSQVMTLPYRIQAAAAALPGALPLMRSEAISPAQWEQRNEWPPKIVDYWVTNENGAKVKRTVDIATSGGATPERVEYDWSYVRPVTDQLYHHAYGIVYESNPRQFSVPSVTVDLLQLIKSPRKYDRDQAGRLLRLEAGDPLFFSADWPAALQGVHFAEGITETIGPDEWTLDLSLVPYAHAMGSAPAPTVPARAWDSARYAWNTETRQWSNA